MAGAVLSDHRHDLLPDARGEGDFGVPHPDVGASLDDSLWGALTGTGRGQSVHEDEGRCNQRPSHARVDVP